VDAAGGSLSLLDVTSGEKRTLEITEERQNEASKKAVESWRCSQSGSPQDVTVRVLELCWYDKEGAEVKESLLTQTFTWSA